MKDKNRYTPKKSADVKTVPFESAEEAWFWFITAQEARNEGARYSAGVSLVPRPCEPADILKCLERLHRNRRLLMDHLLVLRHYGRRQFAPDARRVKEARAFVLWHEAMERLEDAFIAKGIVADVFMIKPDPQWSKNAVVYQGGFQI